MWLEQYKAGQPNISFVLCVAYGFRKHFGVTEQIREAEMQLLPGMLSLQLLLSVCLQSLSEMREDSSRRIERQPMSSHDRNVA